MNTLAAKVGFKGTIAASGTYTFPSWFAPDVVGDYEVELWEGAGSVDATSKTLTGVDFTVTAGPLVFFVAFNKPGLVTHFN